jgi:hypothetical protein
MFSYLASCVGKEFETRVFSARWKLSPAVRHVVDVLSIALAEFLVGKNWNNAYDTVYIREEDKTA